MLPRIHILTHDHVDGSAALTDIIGTLYAMNGKKFPFASVAEWVAYFKDPHAEIVEKFDTVTSVLQSREALQLAAEAYVKRRAAEGYTYVEAKFAPDYHTRGGLTRAGAARAMCDALWKAGNAYGVTVVPHLCINREASQAVGIEIAKIAMSYDGAVVLDMACDEAGHPPEKHVGAYALTFDTDTMRDCHAAEWTVPAPAETYWHRLHQNLLTAIHVLRCDGIGHAVTLAGDDELIKHVVQERIRISGCPLSNLTCGGIKDIRQLQIGKLLDAGVIYTLNSDDDLFLPPMSEVVAACDTAYGFTEAQSRWLDECQIYARFKLPFRLPPGALQA